MMIIKYYKTKIKKLKKRIDLLHQACKENEALIKNLKNEVKNKQEEIEWNQRIFQDQVYRHLDKLNTNKKIILRQRESRLMYKSIIKSLEIALGKKMGEIK